MFLRGNHELDSLDCQIRQQLTWLTYQFCRARLHVYVPIVFDTGSFPFSFPKMLFQHLDHGLWRISIEIRCFSNETFDTALLAKNFIFNHETFGKIITGSHASRDILQILQRWRTHSRSVRLIFALLTIPIAIWNWLWVMLLIFHCARSFDINFSGLSSLLFYLPVPLSCGEQSSRFNPIEIELYTGEMERRCLAKIVWCLSKAETVTSGRRGGEWFLVLCTANSCILGFSNACPPSSINLKLCPTESIKIIWL